MLKGRVVGIQFLHLILGEISNGHFCRCVHSPVHRGQLRGEEPGERCLAVAILAEQRAAVVRVHASVQALQYSTCMGRASCRYRVSLDVKIWGDAVSLTKPKCILSTET